MLHKREIGLSLYGAFRLALLKADGITAFDASPAAAARALQTLFLQVPLWVIYNWPRRPERLVEAGFSLEFFLTFTAVQFLLGFFLTLLVIHQFARALGRAERFPLFVSVYNWGNLVVLGFLFLMQFLAWLAVPEDSKWADALVLGVFMANFIYAWFCAHVSLKVSPGVAMGLTVLQFILFFLLQYVMLVMLRFSLKGLS